MVGKHCRGFSIVCKRTPCPDTDCPFGWLFKPGDVVQVVGKRGMFRIYQGVIGVRLVKESTRHDATALARVVLGGEVISQSPKKRRYAIRVQVDTTERLFELIFKAGQDHRVEAAYYESAPEPR